MDFLISSAYAQAAPAAPQAPGLGMMLLMPLALIVMMFLMSRSQAKRQKEHNERINALQRGDEIVIGSGIAGKIDEMGDTYLSVEIAPNVKIKVEKHAVSKVLPKGSLK